MDQAADQRGDGAVALGHRLGAGYTVGRAIGRGTIGTIHEATTDDGTPIQAEFVGPSLADHRTSARLLQERHVLRQIEHPNVARVIDIVADGDELAIISERVPGSPLASLLAKDGRSHRLAPRATMELTRSVAAGLAAIHGASRVHGDLRPSQIVVDGELGSRIVGFGLAPLLVSARDRTPYRAPELVDGQAAGAAADIYSLGVVVLEMVTGRASTDDELGVAIIEPNQAARAISRVPGHSGRLADLVGRMLAKTPEDRPSAEQIVQALARPAAEPTPPATAAEPPSWEARAVSGTQPAKPDSTEAAEPTPAEREPEPATSLESPTPIGRPPASVTTDALAAGAVASLDVQDSAPDDPETHEPALADPTPTGGPTESDESGPKSVRVSAGGLLVVEGQTQTAKPDRNPQPVAANARGGSEAGHDPRHSSMFDGFSPRLRPRPIPAAPSRPRQQLVDFDRFRDNRLPFGRWAAIGVGVAAVALIAVLGVSRLTGDDPDEAAFAVDAGSAVGGASESSADGAGPGPNDQAVLGADAAIESDRRDALTALGSDDDDSGSTPPSSDPTETTVTSTTTPPTTEQSSSTTEADTTTTPTTNSTTSSSEQLEITARPVIEQLTATSFSISVQTNEVCSGAVIQVVNRSDGTSALFDTATTGNTCAGPLYLWHPGSDVRLGDFVVEPSSTYDVVITVYGTGTNGDRPTGIGTAGANLEVTTPAS